MRSPWKEGSISLRWRMCSGSSSSSTECFPMIGSSGAALPSPACSTSGSPVNTRLITSGSQIQMMFPNTNRTVKKSPYRSRHRSMNGTGRMIHSAICRAAGVLGPGGRLMHGNLLGGPSGVCVSVVTRVGCASGMRLEGLTALVTGGASGIGAATSRRLAAEGARVAVCDLQLEKAREVASEIDGEAFAMDVTDGGSVRDAVAAVGEALGVPTVLVNNAGNDEFSFFKDTDEGLWQRVLDVNLVGVLRVSHALLPGMIDQGGGRVVNVASEAGRVGSNGSAAYSAAKGGV